MEEERRKEREARRKARMEKAQNEEPEVDSSLNSRRRRRRDENEEVSVIVPEIIETEAVEEVEPEQTINSDIQMEITENFDSGNSNESPIEETEIEFDEKSNEEEKMGVEETEQMEISEEVDLNENEQTLYEPDTEVIETSLPIKKPVEDTKNVCRTKRKGLGGLSPEKKKLLRQLIMQKAAEEMKAEAKRRQEIKEEFLRKKVGELDIENMNEAQLQIFLKTLFTRIVVLEGDKYDLEVKIMHQNHEINEITIKVNDGKGKFVKPVLKRVSKTEAQLSRLTGKEEKNSIMDFRENLKSTGLNKYALEEKDDLNVHSKLEWRDNLKATKTDEESENENENENERSLDEFVEENGNENVKNLESELENDAIEEQTENLGEDQEVKSVELEDQAQEIVCEE